MLSIAPISNAGVAVSYYEKDDYYAANGGDPDAQGQWYGKAAEALGLAGAVDRDQFKALLEGTLPDGTQLGRMRDGELQHRPGWDMTFSAPKSVSLMYEIAGDKRVLEAHEGAVREALDWLEKSAAGINKTTFLGYSTEKTGNLAAALFNHDTSRNQDPQLHTHAVMLNLTQRDDGAWRSMNSKPFFEHKMAGGNVYRAALAEALQRIGYDIEQTHADGRFEIAGIDDTTLKAFSTRRDEIVAALKERGLEGAEASAQAALRTRSSKENLDRSELLSAWQERARLVGFQPEQHIPTGEERPRQVEGQHQRNAVYSAIARVSEQEAVFTHAKLVGQVLADGMGKLNVAEAEALIQDRQVTDRGGLYAARIGDRRAWTTSTANAQERAIHMAVSEGRGAVDRLMAPHQVDKELAATSLNSGQRDAIKLMLSSRDQFVGVLGRPGTGKTFMLDQARALYERHGYEMVGLASNAEAAGQLASAAGIEGKTLARHLNDAGRELYRRKTELTPEQRIAERDNTRQVWVVDESSQVSNKQLARLSRMARQLGARVTLIGDPQQLGAIEAGKPFARLLNNGLKHAELDEIRRQTRGEDILAIRSMLAGDIAGTMKQLEGQTQTVETEDARLDAIVAQWSQLEDRDQALVLTSRQVTKQALNERLRGVLRAEGALKDERDTGQLAPVFSTRADLKLSATYKLGDMVRFNRDAASIGVKNGDYWKVASVDPKTNRVKLEKDGQTIDWNPREVGTGASKAAQLYRPRETTVGNGETLIWSRNNPELGLRNGQRLTVAARDAGAMTVVTEDGRKVELDLKRPDHRHWDHGYASTVYKSQGKTGRDVLVNVPSEDKTLLSQKAFLVAISRQKDNLTLYTDDRAQLEKNVRNNLGDKTSAIEGREDRRWFDLVHAIAKQSDDFFRRQERERDPRSPPRVDREAAR